MVFNSFFPQAILRVLIVNYGLLSFLFLKERRHGMRQTTSYAVDIRTKSVTRACRETLRVYQNAVSWLLGPVSAEWSDMLKTAFYLKKQQKYIEKKVHSTKKRKAVYDFDAVFPNMPSYLRRAAINDAIGAYSSYVSNHRNWLDNGKKGSEPGLGVSRLTCPTFYRDNMYVQDMSSDTASLKLFNGKTWDWYDVKLKHTDMQYLRVHWLSGEKVSAPTLEKHYGIWRLRFACTVSVELSDLPLEKQRVLAVDLGINCDAVCSLITYDGTVLARKFINFPGDKGRVWHELNKLKQFQKRHGSHDIGTFWRYVRNLNRQHAYKVARAIADYAIENDCDVIVFEHLDTSGHKIKGSKRQKLAMWRKNTIQADCENIAHRHGIRISRVCAWNTSRLAYDGSGPVERSVDGNYSVCRFQNGRIYNCDLSASYSIGARYFIRAIQKTMNESSWSRIKAEVPDAAKRTTCTLSTLWKITAVLGISNQSF